MWYIYIYIYLLLCNKISKIVLRIYFIMDIYIYIYIFTHIYVYMYVYIICITFYLSAEYVNQNHFSSLHYLVILLL